MTKLTIEIIDDLKAGRLDKCMSQHVEMECVEFARRVLEALVKGGKMVPYKPIVEMPGAMKDLEDGSYSFAQGWKHILDSAPDMLADEESGR